MRSKETHLVDSYAGGSLDRPGRVPNSRALNQFY